MSDQNQQNHQNQGENADKLYAGKFKTIEDLEAGYKNSAVVYDENESLKKRVTELSTTPDTYQNPSDIELDANRIADIQARAKESNMTQAQYEKFLRGDKARVDNHKQNFENAKKEVGEETLNLLTDYVSKHYPKELQQNMLNTFIANKEARQAALNHRSQLLNNQIPGLNKTPAINYHVSDEDVRKAYSQKEKTKMTKDIDRYLNLVAAQAEQQRA